MGGREETKGGVGRWRRGQEGRREGLGWMRKGGRERLGEVEEGTGGEREGLGWGKKRKVGEEEIKELPSYPGFPSQILSHRKSGRIFVHDTVPPCTVMSHISSGRKVIDAAECLLFPLLSAHASGTRKT